MLVLDRRIHEGIWIEGGIFVKVLRIGRNRVKLGIDAPGGQKIIREELRTDQEGADTLAGGKTEGSLRSA